MTPTLFWLLAGTLLCLTELFLPTAFVAFMMGLSAFAVAGCSLVLPYVSLQIFLWMVFSTVFVLLSWRLIPKGKVRAIADSQEAKTLTEIPPGEAGRVIYEGNSWQARCEDTSATIPANQNVIVVGQKGTTLIVLPEHLLHS
ncbi:NfeD family protein [Tychonema sp. LEGE 07203]|uniref:NfeD family protein n=1 Tax=Tychonema sp. LEGE 07203 TaxID=1828671 RepID=UPI001D13D8A1|nr:NfeD family protein [Tychonema sp. LEGE 07203]